MFPRLPVVPGSNQVPMYQRSGMQPNVFFPVQQPSLVILQNPPPPPAPPPPSLSSVPQSPAAPRTLPAAATTKSYRKPPSALPPAFREPFTRPEDPPVLVEPRRPQPPKPEPEDPEKKTRYPPQVILTGNQVRRWIFDVPVVSNSSEDEHAAPPCVLNGPSDEGVDHYEERWGEFEQEAMQQRMEWLAARSNNFEASWE